MCPDNMASEDTMVHTKIAWEVSFLACAARYLLRTKKIKLKK